MFKDIKYLIAYSAPLVAYLNVIWGGSWSFSTAIFLFALLPGLELVLPGNKNNLSEDEEQSQEKKHWFDFILYLNLPLLTGIIVIYFNRLHSGLLETYEIVGMTLGVGFMIGTIGINVAHELGHRHNAFEKLLAKLLLMYAFYMHFTIEHNNGHHKFVSTDEDPSSARKNESIYAFWIRSIKGVYVKAWKLEHKRLEREQIPKLSFKNEMISIHIIAVAYIIAIVMIWSWSILPYAFIIAFLGILLLESVNYIEHYGLRRKKLESGRYEIVGPQHSWNSNHELGRIFLYELTRHSDHHFKSTRKYQVLRHFDESPQLPTGYPGSIIMALFPPFWFNLMNKRIEKMHSV